MDIEFHYHITGILARRAGFSEEDAAVIAYASQHVDDNDTIFEITDTAGQVVYSNYISQTMDILKPKQQLMRIYPIFHFLPGDPLAVSAQRCDGKMHILNTTPNGALAKELFADALASAEPLRRYRIGAATHTFADTWAHQNFVGWYDGFNGEKLNPLPNIGHADSMHHPDWVGHRWTDGRLTNGDIINNHRFLSAAKQIFEILCKANGTDFTKEWAALEPELTDAMGPVYSGEKNQGEERRMQKYRGIAPWLPEYSPHTWMDDAVKTEVKGLPDTVIGFTLFKDRHHWRTDRPAFDKSHWWKFQEAIKAHQEFCMGKLAPIFTQMGVDLRQH
jgi:hypothetical protein